MYVFFLNKKYDNKVKSSIFKFDGNENNFLDSNRIYSYILILYALLSNHLGIYFKFPCSLFILLLDILRMCVSICFIFTITYMTNNVYRNNQILFLNNFEIKANQ